MDTLDRGRHLTIVEAILASGDNFYQRFVFIGGYVGRRLPIILQAYIADEAKNVGDVRDACDTWFRLHPKDKYNG